MQEEQTSETKSLENPNERPRKNNLLGIFLALLLAAGSFVTGTQVTNLPPAEEQTASIFSFFDRFKTKDQTEEVDLSQFWHVWKLMDEKFASASSTENISDQDKINGAIEGMVSAFGDPYTTFFPPAENEAFSEDISGNFSGVGMEIGIQDDIITIIAPLPETPAEKAGLMTGDKIIKINDISTDGMEVDAAVKLIRGEKGTEVKLSIYREGDLEFRDITVVRDTINIPTVDTETIGNTFIIRLFSFNAIAEEKMVEALREFQNSKAKSLVLDLRGNPGGYLQSAVSIAGYFLPTGKVVVKESFRDNNEEKLYRSQGRVVRDFTPENFVVLVDGGSASASEILAGALGEHKVAKIIGVNTFGKGSVQELIQLENNSSVKITVARWLTPNGVSISNGGLTPDIKITRSPEDRLNKIDPQQDAALKYLKGEEVISE
jgi:carboxyl-terminal processing protease